MTNQIYWHSILHSFSRSVKWCEKRTHFLKTRVMVFVCTNFHLQYFKSGAFFPTPVSISCRWIQKTVFLKRQLKVHTGLIACDVCTGSCHNECSASQEIERILARLSLWNIVAYSIPELNIRLCIIVRIIYRVWILLGDLWDILYREIKNCGNRKFPVNIMR